MCLKHFPTGVFSYCVIRSWLIELLFPFLTKTFQVLCILDESLLNLVCVCIALSCDLSHIVSGDLEGQCQCWRNWFPFAVKQKWGICQDKSGRAVRTHYKICWGKCALEGNWSLHIQEALLWSALDILSGWIFSVLLYSADFLCQQLLCLWISTVGLSSLKMSSLEKSGCLGKNVPKIPHWIISLSSDRLCYFCLQSPFCLSGCGRCGCQEQPSAGRQVLSGTEQHRTTLAGSGWAFPAWPPDHSNANFNTVRKDRDVITGWSQLFIPWRRAALLFWEGRQELQFHCASWGSEERGVKVLINFWSVLQKYFQRLNLSPLPCKIYLVLSSLGCCTDSSLPFPPQLIRVGLIMLLSDCVNEDPSVWDWATGAALHIAHP